MRVLRLTPEQARNVGSRALAELGRVGGDAPVPLGELARRRDIPAQFLEQLFAVLRRAGVLKSQRGVKGGYSFGRDPASITVLEIVELLEHEGRREVASPDQTADALGHRTRPLDLVRERRSRGDVDETLGHVK
ncbi:MAG: Rrf2 family transcriptional regulator [Actinobacteria bacterium]|nr:Rrf2 family transcriptional regulator [Actinomycetota bacterium]